MPDTWLSYSLQDFIPFGPDIYVRIFERINLALWPWQLLALTTGALLLYCCRYRKAIPAFTILALAWVCSGYLFQLQYFQELVWAADYFAFGFFIQGALLGLLGVLCFRATPESEKSTANSSAGFQSPATTMRLGLMMIAVSVVLFPLMGIIRNGTLAQGEVFAIMPDPTCLATSGALLCFKRLHMSWWIIPFCWSLVSAALSYELGLSSGFLVFSAALAVIILGVLYRFAPAES